jgi:hypothetical protein
MGLLPEQVNGCGHPVTHEEVNPREARGLNQAVADSRSRRSAPPGTRRMGALSGSKADGTSLGGFRERTPPRTASPSWIDARFCACLPTATDCQGHSSGRSAI